MARGGKREGAGRPKGSGKYQEETKAIRLPVSQIAKLNLKTAVDLRKEVQDFDSESIPQGIVHSQKVKAIPFGIDSESKDCNYFPDSTAVFRLKRESYKIPLYQCSVVAGFPSPAEHDIESELDVQELLIKHPQATFFVRVSGNSMIKAGIHSGDILVVDKSLEAKHGKIVIAALRGELTVKRLDIRGKAVRLLAENDGYPPIEVKNSEDLHIWGVVTNVIHEV
jgi:DNA polymerase V